MPKERVAEWDVLLSRLNLNDGGRSSKALCAGALSCLSVPISGQGMNFSLGQVIV